MKKLISVLLVLMLLGSLCGMSAAYFPDTVTHWARTEILAMADAGVIRGYTDGTFRPDNSITRAEFVTLIVRRYNPTGSGSYSWPMDVAMTSWYYDSFRQAYTAGLIPAEMLSDSRFHADRAITREEAAAILNLALNLPAATGPVYYADLSSIAVYAQDAVANVTAAGIFGGY
ncbi:MAG: S-layer homology domain-containing protein, partial [Clostridiales bacterium]|nr:S-layer homology domain-containing protein [Clostridiales bacterium]